MIDAKNLLGKRVSLHSFNGKTTAQPGTKANENYWLLIGNSGTVVSPEMKNLASNARVLVQFDCDVKSLGLECHNEIENALWIQVTDLIVSDRH